jgi:predicted Fe-Mo cluster-binding NifX family protein
LHTLQEHKIAIASSDGRTIAPHFGSAPLFIICTIRKGRVVGKEERVNRRECGHRYEDTRENCWSLMEKLLPDVRVVVSGGMGDNAYVGLLRRNVLPIVTEERDVEAAVEAYLRNRLKDNPKLVHRPVHNRLKDDELCEIKNRVFRKLRERSVNS